MFYFVWFLSWLIKSNRFLYALLYIFVKRKHVIFIKSERFQKVEGIRYIKALQTRKAIQTSKHDHLIVSERKYFPSRLTTMEAVTLTRS